MYLLQVQPGQTVIPIAVPEAQQQLLRLAYAHAKTSPDPSTQNAAMLIDENGQILVSAVNRFPNKVEYRPERWERPLKYKIIEHAERNVIYAAAKAGLKTEGLDMVCGWAACSDCARGIVQSGIRRLLTHKQALDRSPSFWREEIAVAMDILREGGVQVIFYDGEVGGTEELLHSGKLWRP